MAQSEGRVEQGAAAQEGALIALVEAMKQDAAP
jgi:hypothetical protein